MTATKCADKCDARPDLLLLFWRTRCRRRWSDLKVPIATTTATTDTRYLLLVSLPVPVPIPLPATRYPLLATTNTTPQPLSPAPILSQTSVRSDVITGCPHDRLSWEGSLVKGSCASPNLPSFNCSMLTSLKGCWDWKSVSVKLLIWHKVYLQFFFFLSCSKRSSLTALKLILQYFQCFQLQIHKVDGKLNILGFYHEKSSQKDRMMINGWVCNIVSKC